MTPPTDSSPNGLLDVEEDRSFVDLAAADEAAHAEPGALRRTSVVLATLIALVVMTYAIPGLAWARPWTPADPVPFWNLVGRELLGEGAAAEADAGELALVQGLLRGTAMAAEGTALAAESSAVEGDAPAPQPIEDPGGHALDRFYEGLARTESGARDAITRVSHWGDSAIGGDGMTSAIRRRMQARFGDAGHGFLLLQPPNLSYSHKNVRLESNGKWSLCSIVHRCRKDGRYGYGGVTFWSNGGARSVIKEAREGSPVGRAFSRVELWYTAQPGGGRLKVRADDREPEIIETGAEAVTDAWHVLELGDGPHTVRVTAAGGKVRAHGVVLERHVPGIVWDGMALVGAFTPRLAEQDASHFRAQIDRRRPDLVVLTFGGNDLIRKVSDERYREDLGRLIDLVLATSRRPSCLVMSPLDHGERQGGRIVTPPMVPRLVKLQREVALARGCAFFDAYAAMGGDGAMGRWFRADPPLGSGDLAHLTGRGQKAMAEMLYLALMEGYSRYRGR